MTKEEFIKWERSSIDTIDVKRVYIDVAGDIIAGILLSQIIFWFLPNKEGKNKIRITKKGVEYLAKNRTNWLEECRIKPRQYDTAIKKLKEKGVVEVKNSLFNNKRTPLITVNFRKLIELIDKAEKEDFNRWL
jgi:competence protein ComGC